MRKNVGTIDALMRITLGLYIFGSSIKNGHKLLAMMGAYESASGIVRFCPCYKMLDISTTDMFSKRKMKKAFKQNMQNFT